MTRLTRLTALPLCLALAACGGGGGGSSSDPASDPAPAPDPSPDPAPTPEPTPDTPTEIGDPESTTQTPDAPDIDVAGHGSLDEYREAAGLSRLNETYGAHRAARQHAIDMASNGFFDHEGSDGLGFAARLEDEGCQGVLAENIARGDMSENEVIEAWMESPSHRANILNPTVDVYGLAEVDTVWVMTLAETC